MSQALPGEHLCLDHQGNTSHYDPKNCTICKLQAQLVAALVVLRDVEWKGHRGYCPCCDGWEATPGQGCTSGKHSHDCKLAIAIGAKRAPNLTT